jgi:NADH dehydrogenase
MAVMAEGGKTRILIVGGGFGGVYTAMALERLLRKDPQVEIGLVSKDNYLVFQPLLAEVISDSIAVTDTVTPLRQLCKRTNVYTREVEAIDLTAKVVTTSSGFRPRPYQLEYDHLVVALGNVTSFGSQPGLLEHAFPFKYLGDALTIRNHVIHALEEADIERDPELRAALLTFVVGGGGFSGVECIAELNDFVRRSTKHFRNIDKRAIRVVLLHAYDRILPELPESLARYAQRILTKRGVEVRLNTRLAGATADYALLDSGEKIFTKTVISTVPAAPNPLVASLPLATERGRIVVDRFLQVPDAPGVWAVGDCAWIIDAKTGQPCPPTAQHAIREAQCLAENLVASLRGTPKRAFTFEALGKLASLGHRRAVAEILGVKLSGFFAWFLWRAIYLMKMPGTDRKVRVATDWFVNLLTEPDIVQLKTDKRLGICREVRGAKEVIFQQGDRGDRLYVIVEGEVEVVREDAGRETVLARLGPGECFGEMALVSDNPRMATARTVGPCKLLTLDRDAFAALFSYLPPMRGVFQRLIAERLLAAQMFEEETPR